MDDRRFDALARSFARRTTRRGVLAQVGGLAAAGMLTRFGLGRSASAGPADRADAVDAAPLRVQLGGPDAACDEATPCDGGRACCGGACCDAGGRCQGGFCLCGGDADCEAGRLCCGAVCVPGGTPANCGFCGDACGAPVDAVPTCQGGVCAVACADGFRLCDGACLPVGTCCPSECGVGQVCVAGACCTPTDCAAGGRCGEVDDGCGGVLSCGGCDECESCVGGACQPLCDAGQFCRPGGGCGCAPELACAPPSVLDPVSCACVCPGGVCPDGSCGVPVGAGCARGRDCCSGRCRDGVCVACQPGFHACGGVCVADDDPTHCGDACNPCPAPSGGIATCNGRTCGAVCPRAELCVVVRYDAATNTCARSPIVDCCLGCPTPTCARNADCPVVVGGRAICNDGVCAYACRRGLAADGACLVAAGNGDDEPKEPRLRRAPRAPRDQGASGGPGTLKATVTTGDGTGGPNGTFRQVFRGRRSGAPGGGGPRPERQDADS